MKSSTADLLDLHVEANAEPPRSGFTGALELYDELINFLGLTPETQPQAAAPRETTDATTPEPAAPPPAQTAAVTSEADAQASQAAPSDQATAVISEETPAVNAAANSGMLSNSEDVIRITGTLNGVVAAKAAGSVLAACGDCGEASDSNEMFCIHCGGLLEEQDSRAEAVTSSAAEFCEDCGAMVERDEIFCPSCGSVMANA